MQATLLTLAIAAILALLAALLGPHFVDWTAHRAAFEQQASQVIGLPVKVTGAMDVRLLPSPTLVLSGVQIGEAGDAQALRAKALGIEFALPPLLSGKLRAVELRLVSPEIRVSLTRDGRAVLPNALAGVNTETLSIDKLVIEDATLQLADAASGTDLTLSKLWFNGEVRALPGPIRGEGAFVTDGALYGYRIATARPEPNGSRVKVTVEPADRPIQVEAEGLVTAMNGVPRFDGTAAVTRRVPVKRDRGDVAEPWRVSARVKANATSALFEQVEYQYGPDERALKLHGTAEAKFGDRPRLEAVMSARTLDADKLFGTDNDQPPRAMLAALVSSAVRTITPPLPMQIGFGVDALTLGGATLQNIRGDIEFGPGRLALTDFEARAPGQTQIQASGRIDRSGDSLTFAGPVSLASTDLRGFGDWINGKSANAMMPARPVKFRGEVTIGSDRLAVSAMQAEIDRKAFNGDFSYEFANNGDAARATAVLHADEFDLDPWLDIAASLQDLPDAARPKEISAALAVKRLRLWGVEAAGADTRFTLKGGALSIEWFNVSDFAGLSLEGKGGVDLETRRGTIAFKSTIRDAAGLAPLISRAPAALAEPLQRAALAAAPGHLTGTVTVEPASRSDTGTATIALAGQLGAVDLNLKSVLTGNWRTPGQAVLALDGSLDAANVNSLLKLVAAERLISAPRQPGTFTLSTKGPLTGELTIDTRIVSSSLDMRATGQVHPFGADPLKTSLELAIGTADLVLPGATAKPVAVTFRTRLGSDRSGVRLSDFSGTIARSALRGQLALAFGETLAIDGEVRTDKLDVSAVLAALSGGGGVASKDGKVWSETPFALPAVPNLSGRLTVSAAQAAVTDALQIAKFRSALRFADSNLVVEDIAGELLGGRLSGDLTVRRATDALGLQGSIAIDNADATQLLFGDSAAPLTGQATLALAFEGMGRSPRALVGSLNGTGKLVLDQARIASLDPGVFRTAMQSVDQGLPIDAPRVRDLANRGLEAGPLLVPHAEATLIIAAGVARIDRFEARAEAADLAVSGSYDFSNARVDLRLAMSGPAAGEALAPELAVQLRGPSAKPERTLDISQLTGWLALRSVDRHTKKIEALEQRRPVEDAPAAPEQTPAAQPDGDTAALPRRKLQQPLPPAVEIRSAPSERRRALPPHRAEPQRQETPLPGSANPFPTPIGSPPPPPAPPPAVVRPFQPQSARPLF